LGQPALSTLTLTVPAAQTPVASDQLAATLTCTAACTVSAYAEIAVGGSRPFEVAATAVTLTAAGPAALVLPFAPLQLAEMRAALNRGRRVTASIVGVNLDATGDVIGTAATVLLPIHG
jgi:hypothetical protein